MGGDVIGELLVSTALTLLPTRDGARSAGSRPLDPQAERRRWVDAIETGNWARLERLASAEFSARERHLRRLRTELADLTRRSRLLDEIAPLASSVALPAPLDSRALRSSLVAAGFSRRNVSRAIEHRDSLRAGDVVASAGNVIDTRIAHLDRLARQHMRAMAGAAHSLAVARLNSLTPATDPAAVNRAARSSLAAAWRRYAELGRSGSGVQLAVGAAQLGDVAGRELGRVLGVAAGQHVAGNSGLQSVRHAVLTGDLIRAAIVAQLAAIRVWWLVAAPASVGDRAGWMRAPDAPLVAPPPAVTSISGLAAGSVGDGTLVTLEGVVDAVAIEHRRRKVVSSLRLRDRSGTAIAVVLPYIKIDSGGLVPGAAARVAGVWRAPSPEFNGPAVHLDTISRQELAAQSITGWAATRLGGLYEPVPHSLGAACAWVTGIDGPANPVRYGVWFDRKDR